MSDDPEAKRWARVRLVAAAERAQEGGADRKPMNALEWEDSVAETADGKLLGATELDAIGCFIFGKNAKRRLRGT